MASYNSIGSYDATSVIPEFKGLMQYGDNITSDPRYTADAVNCETVGGVLQPAAACQLLVPELDDPIETLARLYRRWYSGPDDKELLIAASGGKLYYMHPTDDAWTQLPFPPGVDAYASSKWSWVTYEINPSGSPASVDVLLMSNAEDGMIMVRGDDMSVDTIPTPKKFGVIERYAERIWGGAIPEDPDMLVYSAAYGGTDPSIPIDWRAYGPDPDPQDPWAAEGQPEDGAGDINQPSWDGDSFTALKSFGSQLIAFKRTRVWRILGTDPGEYTFKEQYGGGAPYEKTIAVANEAIYMLSPQGVVVYDGLSVNPFLQEYCKNIWARMNYEALSNSCAVWWRGKYYVAFPIDDSTINNAVLIYDSVDRTWLLRTDVYVESFLGGENGLYFTSSTTPGKVWLWQEDSWATGQASTKGLRWITPWNDLSNKSIVKGGFEVYVLCEVKDAPVKLQIGIQTEKKAKMKTLEAVVPDAGKKAKQKRLHFGGSGRRFRLIIESADNTPVFRIVSGISIVSEIDPD